MANPGTPINHNVVVHYPREEVLRRLQMGLSGNVGNYFDGFTTQTDGVSSITIVRKYIPQWAFIGGIIGILLFLLGLLLWLVRTTETTQIFLKEIPGGTDITIRGIISQTQANQINMALSGMI